jgi:hypothetical protein
MRQRKIRGHNRRRRQIEEWAQENLNVRFDLLESYGSDHIDITVHPYCDISVVKSIIPEPKGKTRLLILSGLIDIYNSWKIQLEKTGKPYYLKIWLFEPRFSKSQVVCAVGERIDFYNNTFEKPDCSQAINPDNYGKLKSKLAGFSWENRLDVDYYDSHEVGSPDLYASVEDYEEYKKWFSRLLKKPHKTVKIDETTESYCFTRGNVWLGEQSK